MRQTSAARCRGLRVRMPLPSRREPQLAQSQSFGCGEAAVGVGGQVAQGVGLDRDSLARRDGRIGFSPWIDDGTSPSVLPSPWLALLEAPAESYV